MMTSTGTGSNTEVLVVGGGPAGLATAIAARQAGFRVVVIERRRPPMDKACGEGLMPGGVALLGDLGLDLDDRLGMPFRGIRYLDGRTQVDGWFSGRPGLGIRRTRLHERLVRRAETVGVRLRWGVRAVALGENRLDTDAGPIRTRWLVGADGLNSGLRRWAGLDRGPTGSPRFGVTRHYTISPWNDLVEVHWADRVEAYVTPLAPDEIGVTLLWSGDGRSFDDLLVGFPVLADRLVGAPRCSSDRGAGPLHRRARRVHTGRLALVGDASGFLDAITGEGLSLAFHHAFALASAMQANDLSLYGAAHRRLGRVPERFTRLLLFVERHSRLRRGLLRALAARPAIFSRCLDLLVRRTGPDHSGGGSTGRLARKPAGFR